MFSEATLCFPRRPLCFPRRHRRVGSRRTTERILPEGPEIRRAADKIESVVRGAAATEIYFAFDRLAGFAADLMNRTITRVETRGKAMLMWFEDELAVYSHNQLYGRWMTRKRAGTPQTRRSLRFSVRTERGAAFLFSASDIHVLFADGVNDHPYLNKLGPDPLHPNTTLRTNLKQLRDPRFAGRQLGITLLDQSLFAGIGNYLRSEILFVANIHPTLRPKDLSAESLRALAKAVNDISRRSYRTGGLTNDAARIKELKRAGEKRRYYRHYVFGRDGRPCFTCGDRVTKTTVAGRRLYLCPTCQS